MLPPRELCVFRLQSALANRESGFHDLELNVQQKDEELKDVLEERDKVGMTPEENLMLK